MSDPMRDRLAEAMEEEWPDVNANEAQRMAADLLPTVRALIADELRARADWLWDENDKAAEAYHHLTARADELNPS